MYVQTDGGQRRVYRAHSRYFIEIHNEHLTLLLVKHHCVVDSTNLCIHTVLWLIAR